MWSIASACDVIIDKCAKTMDEANIDDVDACEVLDGNIVAEIECDDDVVAFKILDVPIEVADVDNAVDFYDIDCDDDDPCDIF